MVFVIAGAATFTLVLYLSQSALETVIGVQNVHPEQYVYDYDLAGLSTREHRDLFPTTALFPEAATSPRTLSSPLKTSYPSWWAPMPRCQSPC